MMNDNDRSVDPQDFPDDTTEGTFEMVPVDYSHRESASSLPAAEEVRSTLYPPRHDHRKRNRWALILGGVVVLLIVVLVLAITLSMDKSRSTSAAKQGESGESFGNNGSPSSETKPDFESVVRYLVKEGISDLEDLEEDGSAQNRAAVWLAEKDEQGLPVPTVSKYDTEGYHYVARYIMALNYYAMGGENWRTNAMFLSAADICQWNVGIWGVFCSNEEGRRGNPARLFLRENNMVGRIPKENGHLTSLKSLDLVSNQLDGNIPTELCGIGSLVDLHLSDNEFSGEIPSCLGQLDLQFLFLYENNLRGTIPTELCQLDALLRLSLGNNMLSGEIPACLGQLGSLGRIFLGNSNLEGNIPSELCQLGSLGLLYLELNELSGEIPSCLGKLQSLTRLSLRSNKLKGKLPAEMGNLEKLARLSVDENELTGDPTAVLSNLTSLVILHVDNNNFSGNLDDQFLAASTKLHQTDLSHNNFESDEFPSHLLSLPNLQVLDISKNKLRGNLPSEIPKNGILLSLSLYGNELDGELPAALKNLTVMDHLDLAENRFNGPIPDEIGEMTLTRLLFLSNNQFESGKIPDTFANLKRLTELSLRNTNRDGPLPSYLGSLKGLDLLDLGSNQFTGPIPDTYGDLRGLNYLLLHNNSMISEDLPSSFENLTELVGVYLDRTNMTGNLDPLCKIPFFQEVGNGIIYADCGGPDPDVNCNCASCECCDPTEEGSCSEPGLANIDDIVAAVYRRREYDFEAEDDEDDEVPP